MDAVKLAIPAAVSAASKLIGSEGFGGTVGGGGGVGGGVTVMDVETRESDRISIVIASSIDRCSSSICQKAETSDVNMSQSTFWNKMADSELCRHSNQLSSFHCEEALEELKFGSRSNSTLSVPSLEGKQIQRKSGKVARSSSGGAKRSRMAQMEEVTINEPEADHISEKNQTAKQKNVVNGKRGDKRNGKVTMKGKYDYLSLKAGMASFNAAAGGNNFLGIYGLKSDTYDVTKHLDELSVNELLDGSYKGPNFAKDKGKKAANLNENIVHSVRKSCSILRIHKPLQTQNYSDIDNSCNRKLPTCPVSSDASVGSRNFDDKRDTCTADPSSHDKVQDALSNTETPANVLDFPLCQPKDVLERLALPPSKDLDSLLLDATKPAVSSKNNSDSRGKQIPQLPSLSPFPWSHNALGHCKSNADAIKLSVSRTACQGRWVKIGNAASSLEGGSGFLADLKSLTYDHSLVPLGCLKCGSSENRIAPSTSVSFPWFELGSSSSAARSIASQLPPESSSSLKCEGDAGHSPRLLAAAQTLCDIATHSLKQHGMVRWPKKPLEKTMKACKSKPNGKSGEIFAAPKPVIVTDDHLTKATEVLHFKKPRLLNKEPCHNAERKAPVNWSMPRSSRPSPGKSFRDSFVETKQYNAHAVKQSCMMPPPTTSRVLDKACNSRQKLRKLVPMEWNRGGGKA